MTCQFAKRLGNAGFYETLIDSVNMTLRAVGQMAVEPTKTALSKRVCELTMTELCPISVARLSRPLLLA